MKAGKSNDVQDVSESLNAQIKDIEQEFLIAAVKYYYDKDAFITLG